EVSEVADRSRALEHLGRLDRSAAQTISSADTFFIASAARVDEPTGGVDVSHRGGPPGFVHLEGDTLTIPDYRGNRYFNTLGNLVSNPRAALLFVEFETGDLLHLRGTTEIVWNTPQLEELAGAERFWRLRVVEAWRKRAAVRFRRLP